MRCVHCHASISSSESSRAARRRLWCVWGLPACILAFPLPLPIGGCLHGTVASHP